MCADASGISLYGMGKDREKFIHYLEAFAKLVAQHTLEDVAKEFDKMTALGDTSASFAVFVRNMKTGEQRDQQDTI